MLIICVVISLVIYAIETVTVNELVVKVLAQDKSNYDQKDLEMIKTRHNWVQGFIDDHNGKAFVHLDKALKWRKRFGINQLSDTSFPQELYKMGYIFPYGKGVNGEQIMIYRPYVTGKKFSNKWNEVLKQFIAYRFEKASAVPQKVTLIADYINATLFNINLEVNKFYVYEIRQHFPALIKHCLLVDLPDYEFRIIKTKNNHGPVTLAINGLIALLPKSYQDIVRVIKRQELNKWVANDQLPDFMGGTNKEPFRTIPSGAPTLQEFVKSKAMDRTDYEKAVRYMQQYM